MTIKSDVFILTAQIARLCVCDMKEKLELNKITVVGARRAQLAMYCNNKWNLQIPEHIYSVWVTVGDVVDYVTTELNSKN